MIRIFVVYAVSGFVSLGYQVAWFRIFTDWFGSTNLTFALVVCNFIGGLAVGALLSQRISNFLVTRLALHDRLRLYGFVELLVGMFVLLTVLAGIIPADFWGSFPYYLNDGIWLQTPGYRVAQVAIAATCVFIPCVFMGVTFPLVCDVFSDVPKGGRFPAALYAWNTFGACTGVLVCQFLFLPWMGHTATLWSMAGLNLILGAYFLAVGGEPKHATGAVDTAVSHLKSDAADDKSAWPVGWLYLCAVVSGLLSGSLEGDLFKRISFVIEVHPGAMMSFISFWAILAIFLASALVYRVPRLTLTHIKISFALALAYFVVTANSIDTIMSFIDGLFGALPGSIAPDPTNILAFPANLTELLVFVGVLVFPPYLLVSLMLPFVCVRMQSRKLKIGYVYGWNTLAFCIGLISFTLLAPRVNIFYSLKLFVLLFTIAVVFVSLLRERDRQSVWKPAVFVAFLLGAAMLTPADFDATYFPANTSPAMNPIRSLKSNSANTTFVVGEGEHSALYFGRLRMSATNIRGRTYMRLMAHFPLLLHPAPEKALLICFGAGNTAAAIAAHEVVRQIDILDLNDKVFETAPEFSDTNANVHLDPRVRLIHDDGRNFLNLTDQTYDLITSEPPPPLAAGVYRLYSREYYESALYHLSPEGLMTQWLPMYLMNPDVVDLAISTFLDVFPHTMIFTGFATDFILVGSRSPIDPAILQKRFFESKQVVDDLAKTNVNGPMNLLARIVASDGELRGRYEGTQLILDEHNSLEHLFRDRTRPAIIWYEPKNVLRYIKMTAPDIYDSLDPILTHLGRLRYHVPKFPLETLATVRYGDKAGITLADADWIQIGRLFGLLEKSIDAGRRDQAIDILDRLLAVAEEQPEVLLASADFRLRDGQFEAAMPLLRRFQELEPEDHIGFHLLGRALMLSGRSDDALQQFQKAIELEPSAYLPRIRLAWILATHPNKSRREPMEAIRVAESAAVLTGYQNAEVLESLAAAYASAGQYERAAEAAQRAIDTFSDNAGERLLKALRLHQQAYRNGQSLSDQSLQTPQVNREYSL